VQGSIATGAQTHRIVTKGFDHQVHVLGRAQVTVFALKNSPHNGLGLLSTKILPLAKVVEYQIWGIIPPLP
jgi:hypothetical protein